MSEEKEGKRVGKEGGYGRAGRGERDEAGTRQGGGRTKAGVSDVFGFTRVDHRQAAAARVLCLH